MQIGQCEAIGCRASILPTEVFYRKHFAMLETDIQRLIGKTFRPGRRQSTRFMDALQFAQREILFYQTNRHKMPRDQAFEWDDPAGERLE